MEKVKLTAKQAQKVTKSAGKEWLLNTIFKTIRQAAERGEDKIVWDFAPNFEIADEIKGTLYDMGYHLSYDSDIENLVVEISWGNIGLKEKTEEKPVSKLSGIILTTGQAYLLTLIRRDFLQAAYNGRNKTTIDISNIPKITLNWLIKNLKDDGFNVLIEDDTLTVIVNV